MRNNLHIVMNSFSHGSRILKETASLVNSDIVDRVFILALYQQSLNEHEKLDARRSVWRVKLKSRAWSHSLIIQLIKYIEFCFRAVCYAIKNDINIITIHHLSLLPLGVFLKIILRGKLIYDAHELETETFGRHGVRQLLARFVERTLISFADLVMVVSDSIHDWYRNKYRLANIITVLNCPEFQNPKRTKKLHHELGIPEDKKIILYQGGLLRGSGIEKMLSALSEYKDKHYVGVFMGYGVLEQLIQKYADSYDNIFLKEAVPPSVVLQYTASADIGVAYIDNPSLNDYYCLPNKLFEYIMSGLPVVVNNVPEMKKIVESNEIGIVLDKLTVSSLNLAVSDIEKMDSDQLGSNLLSAAKAHSWDKQAKLMVDSYKKYVFHTS